jgi:thioredoxin reductase
MDYTILGAGPAGLQLGYLLARAGLNVSVLEAGPSPGTFFRTFPRHRTLISVNKGNTGSSDPEQNLRMDWNSLLDDAPEARFTSYSKAYFPRAEDYVRYLDDFTRRHAIPVTYDTRVTRVRRSAEGFVLTDAKGLEHKTKKLVVATGVSKPYVPSIPGIETAELYTDVSVDPEDFKEQRVLILGKGNSAFETADNLVASAATIHVAGPGSLRFAWRTHYVGHLRAVNNNFLDTYQLKSQNAILDGNVVAIEKRDGKYFVTFSFSRANEIKKELRYDRVIVCTGFRFDASIFDPDCRPELVHRDRFPKQTSSFESTNVPDLYFAGTLMQVRDFKKATNAFVHGFRYSVQALARILGERYERQPWPGTELPAEPRALADAVLTRVNRSSALWQLFGVLADVIHVSDRSRARYCEEQPLDRARETADAERWFSVSLEYGPDHDKHDPFDVEVGRAMQNDPSRSHEGHYLHPVVRHFRRGELVATHHVAENLENDWTDEAAHREPLRAFFVRQLGGDTSARPSQVSLSA